MLSQEVSTKPQARQGVLKQKYIHRQLPIEADFDKERTLVFHEIARMIATLDLNIAIVSGVDFHFLVQRFKLVYGMTGQELKVFLDLLLNILFSKNKLAMEIKTQAIKLITYLLELYIQIDGFRVNNHLVLQHFDQLCTQNPLVPSKHFQSYLTEFCYLTLLISKHGQDIMKEVFDFAVVRREIRYIALFVKCLKSRENAEMLFKEMFELNGMWDKDLNWYFIIGVIIRKFPQIDYVPYLPQLFLDIIKNFNDTLSPCADDQDRLFLEETIGIQAAIKSIAQTIVWLIVPASKPHCQQIWMYIQRLVNLILSPLDPSNHVPGCITLLEFLKYFVQSFVRRRCRQQTQWRNTYNEDDASNAIDQTQVCQGEQNRLDAYCDSQFNRLAVLMIRKLVPLQSPSNSIVSLMSILASENTDHHSMILDEIMYVLHKEEDLALETATAILANLLQFTIVYAVDKVDIMIDCARRLLGIIDKLGLMEHMDLLQIVLKMFIYFPQVKASIDSLKEDVLDLIINNLDTISTIYCNRQDQQTQLYLDLANLINPLFFSLDEEQLSKFKDKFVYRVFNGIPQHHQGYEKILMIYSYIDADFPKLIMDRVFQRILNATASPAMQFLEQVPVSLSLENKESLRWYTSIIECTLQYRPEYIVQYWPKLDQVFVNMCKESNKDIFDCGYGMMFNLLISLTQKQLPVEEFRAPRNYKYQTLELHWADRSTEVMALMAHIVDKYVYKLIDFVKDRYKGKLQHRYTDSELVDGILVQFAGASQVSEERKLLQKVIHVMQSVITALLPYLKVEQNPEADAFSAILKNETFECLSSLRLDMIRFLESVLHMSNSFGFLSDPEFVKTFYGLYSDLHGGTYITDMLSPAEVVLSKLKTVSSQRSRNVYSSQYMVIGEVLLNYYLRLDFINCLFSAGQTNPSYMNNLMVLGHHPALNTFDRTIYAQGGDLLHKKHKRMLMIWIQKLDVANPLSYFNLKKGPNVTTNQKERYESAISEIILLSKKVASYLSSKCCVQDHEIRTMLFKLSQVYQNLEKKKDRVILLDNMFSLYTVQFQETLLFAEDEDSLEQRQTSASRMAKTDSHLLEKIIAIYKKYPRKDQNRDQINRLTIGAMQQIMTQCIQSLMSGSQQKSVALYTLFTIIYSIFIGREDPVLSQAFLAFEKCSHSPVLEIYQVNRMGLFHLINRTQRSNLKFFKTENVIKKQTFSTYLMERNFNVPADYPVSNTFCGKYKYMFFNYPDIQGRFQVDLVGKKPLTSLQGTILEFIRDDGRLQSFFEGCLDDPEFTKQDPSQNTKVSENSQTILNYLYDKDPRKINIFADLLDSFQIYGINFYYRLVRKIRQLGGTTNIRVLENLAQVFRGRSEDEFQLMYANLSTAILKCSSNEDFICGYLETLASCNNEIFVNHLAGLYQLFKQNPYTVKQIYNRVISRLREEKGSSRLRHMDVWKIFVLGQGRWARAQAVDGLDWLLKGVSQASAEVAEGIVGCIVQCFILPINLQQMSKSIYQPVSDLVRQKKLFKVNDRVGFETNIRLNQLLNKIGDMIEEEKSIESEPLRVYTNIASKILQSLIIYQFNDFFFDLLEPIIKHIIDKSIEDVSEMEVLKRLGQSEYPYHIYKKLREELELISNIPPLIVRKKLRLLETLMFCRGFSTNNIQIPNIFGEPANTTLVHVICAANIFKAMTPGELELNVNKALAMSEQQKYPILMSLLLSSGTWPYGWKFDVLKTILSWRMKKLVKEFVSHWWKGKGQGSEGQETLAMLVKNVANPYTYFA